ncbi:hypothetical protein KKG29_00245 [Patescibacteria group bacterium]|nr:hypothetical protein [Patescibacteria group bacterium]MBU4056340.1 hypothetical protein [Patescibacteria group bacterium]MBU4368966.1 hypothetical protein [Patescibacteria group bacterium]
MEEKSDSRTKFRRQIDIQQTEEELLKIRREISALEIQTRKYQQEFMRAKINLESAESRMKVFKNQEFELSQKLLSQKRNLYSHSSNPSP